MDYVPDLSPSVRDFLAALPVEVAEHVLDEIEFLLAQPARVSRPSRIWPTGQEFVTAPFREAPHARFAITFLYGTDERTLHITDLCRA